MRYIVDKARLKKLMDQKEIHSFRKLSRLSGVSWKTLNDYTSGRKSPLTSRWEAIAMALNVDPLSLLRSENDRGGHFDVATLESLRKILSAKLIEYPSVTAILFGSRASGQARPFSDWDIGFTMGFHAHFSHDDFVDLRLALSDYLEDFPYVVDLVNLDHAPTWMLDSIASEEISYVCGDRSGYYYLLGQLNGIRKTRESSRVTTASC